jgi:hypothetical protein
MRAKWNRVVQDVRCWIGWQLIKAGSFITESSVISVNRPNGYEWRRRRSP